MSFNIFGQPSKNDIKVGYISTDRGFVDGLSINDANIQAKKSPGEVFIFRTREKTRYLNINEVNALTVDDLDPQTKPCEGVQLDTDIGPPQVYFYGGGGVGVQGNPIIGSDGSLLAVDLIHGGHGYQYAPITEVKDNAGIGVGAVVRSILGDVQETVEVYDQEFDFEEYLIDPDPLAGFGNKFAPDGSVTGTWDPTIYANLAVNPIRTEIEEYQESLLQFNLNVPGAITAAGGGIAAGTGGNTAAGSGKKSSEKSEQAKRDLIAQVKALLAGGNVPSHLPFWNTRKEKPLRVVSEKRETRVAYNVTDETYRARREERGELQGAINAGHIWNKFMNKYAVSPVPPSNARGSDFGLDFFTMEWEEDFPFDGQYIIKGNADAAIRDLFIDGEKVITLSVYNQAPVKVKKFYKAGVHTIRIDLKNGATKTGPKNPKPLPPPPPPPQVTEPTAEAATSELAIDYRGMSDGSGLKRVSDTLVKIDDDIEGSFDENARFEILESTCNAKFSNNGRKLLYTGSGEITIKMKYDDKQGISGLAITDIEVGGKTWERKYSTFSTGRGGSGTKEKRYDTKGSVTKTIKVEGVEPAKKPKPLPPPPPPQVNADTSLVFNSLDSIGSADRPLYRLAPGRKHSKFLKQYGVTPFPTDSKNEEVGTHLIRWQFVEFPSDGNYSIELAADDEVKLFIGNRDGKGRAGIGNGLTPVERGGDEVIVESKGHTRSNTFTKFFKAGKYRLRVELTQKDIGVAIRDGNLIGCAIQIKLASAVSEELISLAPWNDNPMGASVTIDAPLPPPLVEPLPPQAEGRCPNNPIWTTRFPTGTESWYPVSWTNALTIALNRPPAGYWTDFFNRYGISPVPPLNIPGTDAGGVVFTNSWPINAPYDGFYRFVVQRDNTARILLDGNVVFDIKTSGDIIWKDFRGKPKYSSVFITKGNHTITIELINTPSITYKQIEKKIFRSKDFQVPLVTKTTTAQDVPPGGMFLKEGGKYFLLAGGNDIVEIDFLLDYDDDPGNAGIALDNLTLQSEKGDLFFDRKKKKKKGSVSLTGTFKSGNKYAITIGGRASGSKDPVIVDTGPNPDQFQQRINMFDGDGSDVNAKFTALNARQLSPARTQESQELGAAVTRNADGVTYSGPKLFQFNSKAWSDFMNANNVSLYLPPLNKDNPAILGTKDYTFSNVNFTESGQYDIRFQSDDDAELFIDGQLAATSKTFRGTPIVQKVNVEQGKRTVLVRVNNIERAGLKLTSNPTGFALEITKMVSVPSSVGKSWAENPVAISAILIPPPCPKIISGKGVIVDVVVDDPGNGYEPAQRPSDPTTTTTYPASLRLKNVEVTTPGINYNCGVDEIIITPSNGAELSYECDTFGRISKVNVLNPGIGFTGTPDIRIVGPPGPNGLREPTPGVNATFRPQFEVIRDPIVADEAKLIQVTDLVGLKQTGYVDGRAYYGAVFYKEGVRYAGFYETAGELVQVYDTLQESIDAEVTTPPSAIERFGTDITNNDPRLDIPNTPDSLTDGE